MNPIEQFEQERCERIASYPDNHRINETGRKFLIETLRSKYSYNFTWMGRPIIQYPQDIVAMQEIIWRVRPDCIIETGIAHGGSSIFLASMLELLGGNGIVVAVDVDIRQHNRREIENHPLFRRITMIEGSSTDDTVVEQVRKMVATRNRVMLCLDSDHTHTHVLEELRLYTPFVSVGSYCVVFDGIIEIAGEGFFENRTWGPGNSPYSAIKAFLKESGAFEIDQGIENKLVITAAPSGYLKRVR